MCDADENITHEINYLGWRTTFGELKQAGWLFETKHRYRNWRDSKNSSASHDYLYARHPDHTLICRIRFIDKNHNSVVVDYLTHEKNVRTKPQKYWDFDERYTEDDIPKLLEIISSIQAKRPTKRKKLPQAEILVMEAI